MHGAGQSFLTMIAIVFVAWGLVSARLERLNITLPIAFLTVGFVGHQVGGLELGFGNEGLLATAEAALALVLFSDAAGIDLKRLRRDEGLAIRLLGIGLPLTIALGTLTAWLVIPGVSLAAAAVIGASVAPTDAALGLPIVQNRSVAAFVRRILVAESGLNDGIATPFVTWFIAAVAVAEGAGDGVLGAARSLAVGVAAGVVIGAIGAILLRLATQRGWASLGARPFAVLSLAVMSYTVTVALDGNGFIAAFVGGLAFGALMRSVEEVEESVRLVEGLGSILGGVLWLLFGTIIAELWTEFDAYDVLFAVLALTVVRMLPVALCLIGSRLDRPTVAFIGWAGPRGLASLVFTLLAVEALGPQDARPIMLAILMTVAFSVIAHGVSAAPSARWFARTPRRSPMDHDADASGPISAA